MENIETKVNEIKHTFLNLTQQLYITPDITTEVIKIIIRFTTYDKMFACALHTENFARRWNIELKHDLIEGEETTVEKTLDEFVKDVNNESTINHQGFLNDKEALNAFYNEYKKQ